MDSFTPLGWDEDGRELRVVTFYDPLAGTETRALDDHHDFPLRGTLTEAAELCVRMDTMDQTYWPPVNPFVGRVEDGRVVALVIPDLMTDDGIAALREVASQARLPVEAP